MAKGFVNGLEGGYREILSVRLVVMMFRDIRREHLAFPEGVVGWGSAASETKLF